MATLYSIVVIEVGFADLSCKNSIQKHDGEAVMLLGILYDTECFLTWDGTLQTKHHHQFFVKQRCLPYGVLANVKKKVLCIGHSTVY